MVNKDLKYFNQSTGTWEAVHSGAISDGTNIITPNIINNHFAQTLSRVMSATHTTQAGTSTLEITFTSLLNLKSVVLLSNIDAQSSQMCWGLIGQNTATASITDWNLRVASSYAQVTFPVYFAESGSAAYFASCTISGNKLTLSFTNSNSYPTGRTISIKALGFAH